MKNEYSKFFKITTSIIGYPNPEKLLKLVAKNPMTIEEFFYPKYYMTKYRDFYYRFKPKQNQMSCDVWEISDRKDRMGFVLNANADIYRIDQIIEMYEKKVNEIYGR